MLMTDIFGRDVFDDLFSFPAFDEKEMKKTEKKLYGHKGKNLMKTDVQEKKDCYHLEMELPGFKKENIHVELNEGYLTISAEKKAEQGGRFLRKERYEGMCERSFYVGDYLTEEDIKGQFRHGILTLTIPKQEAKPAVEEKKYITIEG